MAGLRGFASTALGGDPQAFYRGAETQNKLQELQRLNQSRIDQQEFAPGVQMPDIALRPPEDFSNLDQFKSDQLYIQPPPPEQKKDSSTGLETSPELPANKTENKSAVPTLTPNGDVIIDTPTLSFPDAGAVEIPTENLGGKYSENAAQTKRDRAAIDVAINTILAANGIKKKVNPRQTGITKEQEELYKFYQSDEFKGFIYANPSFVQEVQKDPVAFAKKYIEERGARTTKEVIGQTKERTTKLIEGRIKSIDGGILDTDNAKLVYSTAIEMGVDPIAALSIYGIESDFGRNIKGSGRNAKGHMQVTPDQFNNLRKWFGDPANRDKIMAIYGDEAKTNAIIARIAKMKYPNARGYGGSESSIRQVDIVAGMAQLIYNQAIGLDKSLWGAGYQANADKVLAAGAPLGVDDGNITNSDYNSAYVTIYNHLATKYGEQFANVMPKGVTTNQTSTQTSVDQKPPVVTGSQVSGVTTQDVTGTNLGQNQTGGTAIASNIEQQYTGVSAYANINEASRAGQNSLLQHIQAKPNEWTALSYDQKVSALTTSNSAYAGLDAAVIKENIDKIDTFANQYAASNAKESAGLQVKSDELVSNLNTNINDLLSKAARGEDTTKFVTDIVAQIKQLYGDTPEAQKLIQGVTGTVSTISSTVASSNNQEIAALTQQLYSLPKSATGEINTASPEFQAIFDKLSAIDKTLPDRIITPFLALTKQSFDMALTQSKIAAGDQTGKKGVFEVQSTNTGNTAVATEDPSSLEINGGKIVQGDAGNIGSGEQVKQGEVQSPAVYIDTPAKVGYDLEQAKKTRTEAVQIFNIAKQKAADYKRIAEIYRISGDMTNYFKYKEAAEGMITNMVTARDTVTKVDAGMVYLQGMQGLNDLRFGNSTARLSKVWSMYSGRDVRIVPRSDGNFDLVMDGQTVMTNQSQRDISHLAQLQFDAQYRETVKAATAEQTKKLFDFKLDLAKERDKMLNAITQENYKQKAAAWFKYIETQLSAEFKAIGDGSGRGVIQIGTEYYLFDPQMKYKGINGAPDTTGPGTKKIDLNEARTYIGTESKANPDISAWMALPNVQDYINKQSGAK